MPRPPSPPSTLPKALAPLRHPLFAQVWTAWLLANLCTWMCEVAAAWMMTRLTDSKFLVSLVQVATTLPVFLLALPAGALADMVNRRIAMLGAQVWTTLTIAAVAALEFGGWLSALALLALVFASSMANAIRWPVFSAGMPEVVDRAELPEAIALHGIAVNFSRIAGPLIAGMLVSGWGGAWVFLLGTAMSLASVVLLWRWQHREAPQARPVVAMGDAIRTGLAFARDSWPFRAMLLRSAVFFMSGTGFMGLLPLVAIELRPDDGGHVYAVLFACLGTGAVTMGFFMLKVRATWRANTVLGGGSCLLALCIAALGLTHVLPVAMAAMFVCGCTWIAVGNTLSVAAQVVLPDGLRARGMSLFLMSFMVGGAIGAAIFGAAAEVIGLREAVLALAASTLLLCALLHKRFAIADD